MAEQKVPIAWAEISTKGWADSLSASEPRGGSIVLSGKCPRCEHLTTITLNPASPGNPGGGGIGALGRVLQRAAEVPKSYGVVAICHCTTAHPGAPAGKDGCGAFGGLQLGMT